MKKVFGSHRQLAHVWAQQNTPEGYSSDKRMFFEGPTLYSYGRHYAIAQFSIDRKGNPVVLFNSSGYSPSTGTHTTIARRAVSVPIVELRDPTKPPQWTIEFIDLDFANLLKKYGSTTHGGAKAKIVRTLEALNRERNDIGNYLIKGFRPKALPKDLAKHAAKLVEADKAKAKAAEEKRFEALNTMIREVEESLGAKRDKWPAMWRAHFVPGDGFLEREAWGRAIHLLQDMNQPILMRVKPEPKDKVYLIPPDTIETSRGAEFPIDAALRALPVIRRMKKQGKSWQRNGETLPIGSFQIDTIYPDGNVKAGCHLVTYAEIELLAKELGQ